MKRNQAADEVSRSLYVNITVGIVFVSLILAFIVYSNDGSTDLRRMALENLAEQFSTSVSNAHWQWQSEGRPQLLMVITYANKLGKDKTLIETHRKPISMSRLGWPKAEPTAQGCTDIWKMLLDQPMNIDGFKINAEYYAGLGPNNNAPDSICRYRLSTGAYFEYKVLSGQVLKVKL